MLARTTRMSLAWFASTIGASLVLATQAHAVTLVHTNDVMGEVEPCGCRNNPQGGMARKANWLKRSKDQEIIQVDAGDLLFPTEVIPPLLEKQSKLQAEYVLKAHDLVKHDAVVPGEKDFALGWDTFEGLRKKTKIKFIAANLKKAKGGKAFEPHLIIEKKTEDGKPLKVAIFGLVGEDLRWPKELKASSAIEVAKEEMKALKGKADIIVALTHQGAEKDEALAKAVPGIDIIIGGHTQSFFQAPLQVGSTRIYQSSFRNQYVGAIPLKKPFDGEGYQLIGLDAGYESPAQAPSAMDDLVKEFKTAIAELNSREEVLAQASAQESQGDAHGSAKFQTFARCSECHLKQFDFWRKTQHALALGPLLEKDQFLNKECLTCHTVGLGDPKGFSQVKTLAETRKTETESQAFETRELGAYLRAMHDAKSLDSKVKVRSADAEAVPLRQSLNRLNRSWTPVQCENCHQPGYDHPFSAAAYPKKVENATCLKCHTPDRAPEWYVQKGSGPAVLDEKKVEAKRALVRCPAGDISSEN